MEDSEQVESVTSGISLQNLDLGFKVSTFVKKTVFDSVSDSVMADHDLTVKEKSEIEVGVELVSEEMKGLDLDLDLGGGDGCEKVDVKVEEEVELSDRDRDIDIDIDVVCEDSSRVEEEDVKKEMSDNNIYHEDDVKGEEEEEKKRDDHVVEGWGDVNCVGVIDVEEEKSEVEKNGWNHDDDGGGGWNDYDGYDGRVVHVKSKEEDGSYGWNDGYDNGDKEQYVDNENFGPAVMTGEDRASRRVEYPRRDNIEDCSFYVRTGTCKFGLTCRFNHPAGKKSYQGVKEKMNAREEYSEQSSQIECKYYLTPGGCKYGKDCRFNHSRGTTTLAPVIELNFVGLPIRPGEKECPYYMRTGSCKYAANCRFNHPEPTSGSDPSSGYSNGPTYSLQGGGSQPPVASWSSSRPITETAPYVPMVYPPIHGLSSQDKQWNGYQAPSYPTERTMRPPTAYVMNNTTAETNIYPQHSQQMVVEEFPERPGQPECSYYLKTGDCKYRSNCKFHHPKGRIIKSTPCVVTDKGLPLRPDQNICSHYSRYGICKFGPNCRFDHPTNIGSPAVSGPERTITSRFGGTEAVM